MYKSPCGPDTLRGHDDIGGASRFVPVFRWEAKAPGRERPRVDGKAHPTVKPVALMRWLCRLVTPPDGLIVDPYVGSGTTLEAAYLEGFSAVGVDSDPTAIALSLQRLEGAFGDVPHLQRSRHHNEWGPVPGRNDFR